MYISIDDQFTNYVGIWSDGETKAAVGLQIDGQNTRYWDFIYTSSCRFILATRSKDQFLMETVRLVNILASYGSSHSALLRRKYAIQGLSKTLE